MPDFDMMVQGGRMMRGFPGMRFPGRFPRFPRFRHFPRRFFPFFPIFIRPGFPGCFFVDRFGRCCDRFGRCCDRFGRCFSEDFDFDFSGMPGMFDDGMGDEF